MGMKFLKLHQYPLQASAKFLHPQFCGNVSLCALRTSGVMGARLGDQFMLLIQNKTTSDFPSSKATRSFCHQRTRHFKKAPDKEQFETEDGVIFKM